MHTPPQQKKMKKNNKKKPPLYTRQYIHMQDLCSVALNKIKMVLKPNFFEVLILWKTLSRYKKGVNQLIILRRRNSCILNNPPIFG